MNKSILKKYMAVMLAAAMCAGIASCGKQEKKSQLEEASTSNAQTKVLEEAKEQTKLADKEEDGKEDKKEEKKSEEKKSDDKNSALTQPKGSTSHSQSEADIAYESEYVGVKFELPEGYIMAPESEIKAQNEQMAQAANEGQKYIRYEASASNPDEKTQVIVSIDGNKGEFDEITYLANVAASYEKALQAEIDRTAVYRQIGSHNYATMKIKSKMGMLLYCVRKSGDDIIAFIVSYPEGKEQKADELLSAFKPY